MPYDEASKKAYYRYRKTHLKRVPLDISQSEYARIKEHAQARNESVNGFIKRAINEAMTRDKDISQQLPDRL